jgi:glycolate oxidase FAD binding subunit
MQDGMVMTASEAGPPSRSWLDELPALVGDDAVRGGESSAIAGQIPACTVLPANVDQVSEVMAFAHQRRLAVIPCGNGTHLHVGSPPARYDLALSMQRLDRVVAHEAADMTVTAEAGLTVTALNETLARARQWLPLDPPAAERVTLGGLIAADLNGPLRLSHGKVRDLLLGVTVVLADGSVVKGGGRVVKNVAGYDVPKLYAGSLGTLGVIVEATFKLRPRPEKTKVVSLTALGLKAAGEIALRLLDEAIAPLFLELLDARAARDAGVTLEQSAAVIVGLGGTAEEIEAQEQVLQRCCGQQLHLHDPAVAERLQRWLRDFALVGSPTLTARVSLLPHRLADALPRIASDAAVRGLGLSMVAHAGNGVARLRLESGDDQALLLFAEALRLSVRERGGWVVFDRLPKSLHGRLDSFGNPTPAVLLMRAVKRQLDPQGILSPGRFVGGI